MLSDKELKENVLKELEFDNAVKATDIGVIVEDGAVTAIVHHGLVTLNGKVSHEKQRRNIEKQIAHVAGVNTINNRIEIEPTVEPKNVKDQITAALKRNAELECAGINVSVEGDKVILTGRVKAFYERELAQLAAWRAHGVRQVIDKITVGN